MRGSIATDAPVDTLTEIKRLYYNATRTTIERDVRRAIELLKSMLTDDERDRAAVYMSGLADMRKEWAHTSTRRPGPAQKRPRR